MVSFIVPVYRCEDSLRRCAESILGQTYGDLELILVDDGSPDGSGALCDCLAREDSRVRVIHKENGGPSSARNRGLEEARGTYVQFVDSDDYIDPDMTQRMVQRMEQEQVQLVVCGLVLTHPDGEELRAYPDIRRLKVEQMAYQIPDFFHSGFPNSPCTKLYRREYLNHRFDETMRFGEDLMFNLDYFRKIQVLSVMDFCPLHYVVDNPNSITGKAGAYRVTDTLRYYGAGAAFYRELGNEDVVPQFRREGALTLFYAVMEILPARDVSEKDKRELVKHQLRQQTAREILVDDPTLAVRHRLSFCLMRHGCMAGLKILARIYQKRT